AGPQKVTVVYKVTSKGAVEDVRVRESTDPCFNDTAIAAVRSTRFDPAMKDGVTVDQEDLETTFRFVLNSETTAQDFDARPIKRYPPSYPESCMNRAGAKESVFVEFDVTADGETANPRVVDSTYSCFNSSALAAVKKWKYQPKIEDGEPVARNGVQTVITYEISGSYSGPRNRVAVARKLNSIAAKIRSGRNPQEVLAELAEVEAKYGDDFTPAELRAFYQLRGAARLAAKDYRGALDDFRVVRRLGISGESGEAVVKTIEQLEAYVAAEDAGALPPAEAAEAPAAQPDADEPAATVDVETQAE
ncbi:MAG: energy transducer TonB, partial [Pseudomonadota bacterium]